MQQFLYNIQVAGNPVILLMLANAAPLLYFYPLYFSNNIILVYNIITSYAFGTFKHGISELTKNDKLIFLGYKLVPKNENSVHRKLIDNFIRTLIRYILEPVFYPIMRQVATNFGVSFVELFALKIQDMYVIGASIDMSVSHKQMLHDLYALKGAIQNFIRKVSDYITPVQVIATDYSTTDEKIYKCFIPIMIVFKEHATY